MGHETTIRANLAKVYVMISNSEMNPERMRVASEKLEEAIGILNGTLPLPAPMAQSEERG